MKIQDVKNQLNEFKNADMKLASVKLINDIRGGGLLRSKEIADAYYTGNSKKLFGTLVIEELKASAEWSTVKKNIRALTIY